MEEIKCDNCGSRDFSSAGSILRCNHCSTLYKGIEPKPPPYVLGQPLRTCHLCGAVGVGGICAACEVALCNKHKQSLSNAVPGRIAARFQQVILCPKCGDNINRSVFPVFNELQKIDVASVRKEYVDPPVKYGLFIITAILIILAIVWSFPVLIAFAALIIAFLAYGYVRQAQLNREHQEAERTRLQARDKLLDQAIATINAFISQQT